MFNLMVIGLFARKENMPVIKLSFHDNEAPQDMVVPQNFLKRLQIISNKICFSGRGDFCREGVLSPLYRHMTDYILLLS